MIDLDAIKTRYRAAMSGPWHTTGSRVLYTDIPTLVAEVERLQRELHDMTIRYDEQVKMYNRAVAESATWESLGRDFIDYPEPNQINEKETGNAGT